MKKIFLTLLFSIFTLFGIGQIKNSALRTFYYNENKLDYFLHEGIKDSSLFYAKELSQFELPISIYSYRSISKAYYLNGNIKEGGKWLLKDVTMLGYSSISSLRNRFLNYEKNMGIEYQFILHHFDSLNKASLSQKNIDQISIITKIHSEDQKDRESSSAESEGLEPSDLKFI